MGAPSNADIAKSFITLAASGRVREAYERHVATDFRHHNAYFPADRESLLLAMEQAAAREPNKSCEVRQVIDGGDRVALLSHVARADVRKDYAVVHIFRIEDSRIVEMWDIAQEIPADSPNALGMF